MSFDSSHQESINSKIMNHIHISKWWHWHWSGAEDRVLMIIANSRLWMWAYDVIWSSMKKCFHGCWIGNHTHNKIHLDTYNENWATMMTLSIEWRRCWWWWWWQQQQIRSNDDEDDTEWTWHRQNIRERERKKEVEGN